MNVFRLMGCSIKPGRNRATADKAWPVIHPPMRKQKQGAAAAGEERATHKGHLPVLVGLGQELRRFTVRVEELSHPSFVKLLDMAAREFGYRQEGVLRIPCDEKRFGQVMQEIAGKPVR